jgi:arginine decarboxylase
MASRTVVQRDLGAERQDGKGDLILFPALVQASRKVSFHTSGNKAQRRKGAALQGRNGIGRRLRFDPWLVDSSVSDGSLGSLFDPWGDHPIGRLHEKIARIYGVRRAFVSTNGTTTANKLALYTLLNPGDKVLVERDYHVSVLQTLNEIGAVPVWLLPQFDEELGVNLASTPEAIARELKRHPDIRAVVLTSPKYFGVVGDIRRCVAICHAHGVPVLVDEAHGACLIFHPALPTSATEAQADLVTQSTHKTTEAWSQGSVLLVNNEALCPRLLQVLHGTPAISTSFHYGIVASVEDAVSTLAREGELRLEAALRLADALRRGVREIPGLRTWGQEKAGRPGFRELDPLRVTVDVSGLGLTGLEVEARLQQNGARPRPVVAELGDLRQLLFIVTYGDSQRDVETALGHLKAVAASAPGHPRGRPFPRVPRTLPEQVMPPREAFWAVARGRTRRVPVKQAIGEVSGECVAVYPPGNAILVHGEVVTEEAVDYLREVALLGAHLKGASDRLFEHMDIIDPC